MRKLFSFIVLLCSVVLGANGAHAAEMVNVEYIHKLIERDWGITVPYGEKLGNVKYAANMKYLLTVVDRANEILNGRQTTHYGDDEKYANKFAADTIATNKAVAELIQIKPQFFIKTKPDTTKFAFTMTAQGGFMVDWGDGTRERIIRADTAPETYSHDYATAGERTIGIGGRAMLYSASQPLAAISFSENADIVAVSGGLGRMFRIIGDGKTADMKPQFYQTFYGCIALQTISDELFSGINGVSPHMFHATFQGCSALQNIPENLFSGISGTASWLFQDAFNGCTALQSIPENLFADVKARAGDNMFGGTFQGCTGITSIPANLFKSITGPANVYMFRSTFRGCTRLTQIPDGLFSTIGGPLQASMFNGTFSECSALQSIPENLFGDLTGGAANLAFSGMFRGCKSLSGPSARINGKYLYEIWPDHLYVGWLCYHGTTGLADYDDIPDMWK